MLQHYPYTFLMRDISGDVPVLVYHFRSPKTRQWYIVRVEEYPSDFYGIKFYLKADRLNPNKFNRLTGLNEPRSIINTCIAILMDLTDTCPEASFGFIGSNIIGEDEYETKRFRVYRRMLTTYFSEEQYHHYQIVEKSAYALVSRKALSANPDLIKKISTYFSDNYTNFE